MDANGFFLRVLPLQVHDRSYGYEGHTVPAFDLVDARGRIAARVDMGAVLVGHQCAAEILRDRRRLARELALGPSLVRRAEASLSLLDRCDIGIEAHYGRHVGRQVREERAELRQLLQRLQVEGGDSKAS